MAGVMVLRRRNQRALRRERVFRDRTHPLESCNDRQVLKKFRFPRHVIFQLSDELKNDIEYPMPRKGSLSPVLQVCLTLRYYATGSFQSVLGDLIGVDQSTACRTIHRVTAALRPRVDDWVKMPTQAEADRQKQKFYAMRGFPNVIGCIDGTQIPIQGPHQRNHEFVNRKHFHSINTQVSKFCELFFYHVYVCVTKFNLVSSCLSMLRVAHTSLSTLTR